LAKILAPPTQKILEVNCGTGEDALWLSAQNYEVTATDISEAMIGVAKAKVARSQWCLKPSTSMRSALISRQNNSI
jgi:ubiquinone/menaquinone biosynthesis C-methylase UbiE